jgi:hypothetical protein
MSRERYTHFFVLALAGRERLLEESLKRTSPSVFNLLENAKNDSPGIGFCQGSIRCEQLFSVIIG